MPGANDAFERILKEVSSRLSEIHLDLPSFEGGGAAPPSPEAWAAASLELPPAPRAAAESLRPLVVQPLSPEVSLVEPPLPRVDIPEPSSNSEVVPTVLLERPSLRKTMRGATTAGAILLAVLAGVWWNRTMNGTQVLPLASFDAIAARSVNEWIVAQARDLLLYHASFKPRALAKAPVPLTSIFEAEGTLYGSDGKSTLFHWETMDEPPTKFPLDHSPVAIYARPPYVWTLDTNGSLRQFILSRSMTGVFLQPLDRAETSLSGDFSLAEDGTLILLERSSGQLLRLTRENSSYAVTARGASYGAGARLISTGRGLKITRADGTKTTIVSIPALPR